MTRTETRKDYMLPEHFKYLNALQQSGKTNMFGAANWLEGAFPRLSQSESNDTLVYWMENWESLQNAESKK